MSQYDYEKTLLGYIDSVRAQMLARPLNLGGVTSSGGGAGGGTGYIGQLPQTRVTYDTSEVAASGLPVSGWSLLDNLNHIRYRIYQLESNPAAILSVKENGTIVSSGVTVIDFINAAVTETSPGVVTVTSQGGSGGSSHAHTYNVTLSGTTHFTTPESFNSGTLRVYYNGIRQDDSYFTADGGNGGFTLTFSTNPGDEVFVDYDTTASGVAASGVGHTIQDEGTPLTQRTNLNFVGAGVTVTDDAGNDATKVTITASGGGGGVTWDGNPLTVNMAHASESNNTTNKRRIAAEIRIMSPVKITEIGYDVKISGHYNLKLSHANGATSSIYGDPVIRMFASGVAAPSSGMWITTLNPAYILYPGTYYIVCESSYFNTTFYFNGTVGNNYGTPLFNAFTWYSDGAAQSSNNAAIYMTAERGDFTG